MSGAAFRSVSGVGASMCGEGKEEDAGGAATDAVGAGVVSTCLSCDGGVEGRGGDEALGGSGGVMEAAVGCVRGSIVVGSGVGMGIG
jgi:hypothetical protein